MNSRPTTTIGVLSKTNIMYYAIHSSPTSSFCASESNSSSVQFRNECGIIPIRTSTSDILETKRQRRIQNEPVNLLWLSPSCVSCVQNPISTGISPIRLLAVKNSFCKLLHLPIDGVMKPAQARALWGRILGSSKTSIRWSGIRVAYPRVGYLVATALSAGRNFQSSQESILPRK